jgi:hypothetical protein
MAHTGALVELVMESRPFLRMVVGLRMWSAMASLGEINCGSDPLVATECFTESRSEGESEKATAR